MIFVVMATLSASAQDFKFAYFSYDAALKAMAEYGQALSNVDKLRTQYDNEIMRAEKEFNAKYEDFLENQRTMAPAILDKRQAAYAPLKAKLNAAIKKIGAERGYAFILNTDGDACPYVDSTKGDDINMLISDALR